MKPEEIKTLIEKINSNQKHKLHYKEQNYLKKLINNDKLGLKLNFNELEETFEGEDIDALLEKYYFFFTEHKSKNIIKNENKHNNLLIEGENYFALKALIDAKVKVDIIYIDPPYNTGKNDFVYNDTQKSNEIGWVNNDDPFRHSKWLSFMKRRLILVKELLVDGGVIFVSIDDNEQAYLKVLMDEIFGENNFIGNINWQSSFGGKNDTKKMPINTEYILFYGNNTEKLLKLEDTKTTFKEQGQLSEKYGKCNKHPLARSSLTY